MFRSPLRRLSVAAVLTLVCSTIALSGPPWMAIEYPVNPHDPNTRDAFLTVRTYHHGNLLGYDISGTAEGLVNGRRQSTRLDIRRLPQAGMYVVRWQKPAQGTWALLITSTREGNHMASALVAISASGRVAGVTVPTTPIEGGRWQAPRKVASNELEAMLRSRVM
ncbi:MAG TPA: hypothetical protein VM939_05995 [Gemmatimonadaceae bacterium]|nr:hypothetical protein [Gemmatimonadaceae bacterium]